jgi:putative intracellular protease/amidase
VRYHCDRRGTDHGQKTWDYDAFVFIGGESAPSYFDDQQVRKLASDVKYKTVAATGSAGVILTLAEVLSGKKATCSPEYGSLLVRRGARFTNQGLEADGKIITLFQELCADFELDPEAIEAIIKQ